MAFRRFANAAPLASIKRRFPNEPIPENVYKIDPFLFQSDRLKEKGTNFQLDTRASRSFIKDPDTGEIIEKNNTFGTIATFTDNLSFFNPKSIVGIADGESAFAENNSRAYSEIRVGSFILLEARRFHRNIMDISFYETLYDENFGHNNISEFNRAHGYLFNYNRGQDITLTHSIINLNVLPNLTSRRARSKIFIPAIVTDKRVEDEIKVAVTTEGLEGEAVIYYLPKRFVISFETYNYKAPWQFFSEAGIPTQIDTPIPIKLRYDPEYEIPNDEDELEFDTYGVEYNPPFSCRDIIKKAFAGDKVGTTAERNFIELEDDSFCKGYDNELLSIKADHTTKAIDILNKINFSAENAITFTSGNASKAKYFSLRPSVQGIVYLSDSDVISITHQSSKKLESYGVKTKYRNDTEEYNFTADNIGAFAFERQILNLELDLYDKIDAETISQHKLYTRRSVNTVYRVRTPFFGQNRTYGDMNIGDPVLLDLESTGKRKVMIVGKSTDGIFVDFIMSDLYNQYNTAAILAYGSTALDDGTHFTPTYDYRCEGTGVGLQPPRILSVRMARILLSRDSDKPASVASTDADIIITFSEPIYDKQSGAGLTGAALSRLVQVTVGNVPAAGPRISAINANQVKISGRYRNGTTYAVTTNSGRFRDSDNLDLPGESWYFRPSVTSVAPKITEALVNNYSFLQQGSTPELVGLSDERAFVIRFGFSKAVRFSTGVELTNENISNLFTITQVYRDGDYSSTIILSPGVYQVSVSDEGDSISISGLVMHVDHVYTIAFNQTLQDYSGNSVAGIRSFSFKAKSADTTVPQVLECSVDGNTFLGGKMSTHVIAKSEEQAVFNLGDGSQSVQDIQVVFSDRMFEQKFLPGSLAGVSLIQLSNINIGRLVHIEQQYPTFFAEETLRDAWITPTGVTGVSEDLARKLHKVFVQKATIDETGTRVTIKTASPLGEGSYRIVINEDLVDRGNNKLTKNFKNYFRNGVGDTPLKVNSCTLNRVDIKRVGYTPPEGEEEPDNTVNILPTFDDPLVVNFSRPVYGLRRDPDVLIIASLEKRMPINNSNKDEFMSLKLGSSDVPYTLITASTSYRSFIFRPDTAWAVGTYTLTLKADSIFSPPATLLRFYYGTDEVSFTFNVVNEMLDFNAKAVESSITATQLSDEADKVIVLPAIEDRHSDLEFVFDHNLRSIKGITTSWEKTPVISATLKNKVILPAPEDGWDLEATYTLTLDQTKVTEDIRGQVLGEGTKEYEFQVQLRPEFAIESVDVLNQVVSDKNVDKPVVVTFNRDIKESSLEAITNDWEGEATFLSGSRRKVAISQNEEFDIIQKVRIRILFVTHIIERKVGVGKGWEPDKEYEITFDETKILTEVDSEALGEGTLKRKFIPIPLVKSENIKDDAVIEQHIKDLSVTETKLADMAVTNVKLADDAVTNIKILDDTIEGAKLKDNSIIEAKIAAGAVTTAKIAAGAVGTAQLTASVNATLTQVATNTTDIGTNTTNIGTNTTNIASNSRSIAANSTRISGITDQSTTIANNTREINANITAINDLSTRVSALENA